MAGGVVSRGVSGEARVLGEPLPAVTPSWLICVFLWGSGPVLALPAHLPVASPNTPAQEVGAEAEDQVPT